MRFCPLYSGSSGNAAYVAGGGVRLLVDAGLPGRKIAAALRARGEEPTSVDGLLVTHDHSDHIAGVAFSRANSACQSTPTSARGKLCCPSSAK